jgi:predicted DNA-binding protein (UPF0251 family)
MVTQVALACQQPESTISETATERGEIGAETSLLNNQTVHSAMSAANFFGLHSIEHFAGAIWKVVARSPNPEAMRIHSEIVNGGNITTKLEHYLGLVKLWYGCRHLDQVGSGKVETTIPALAQLIGVSRGYVRQLLRADGFQVFFRGCVKRKAGRSLHLSIYMRSLFDVIWRLGLSSMGAVTEITLAEFRAIRLIATEAFIQRRQKESHYQSKHQPVKKQQITPAIADLFPQPQSSHSSRGASAGREIRRIGRYTLLTGYNPQGASQTNTAKKMGRSPSTIQRQLSRQQRQKRGMNPLIRTQTAYATGQRYTAAEIGALKRSLDAGMFRQYYWDRDGWMFTLGCNVYLSDRALFPSRRTAAKLKAFLEAKA